MLSDIGMMKQLCAILISLSLTSQNVYAGQYKQQCEQDSKKSKEKCDGAAGAAQAGDAAQANAIGSTTGATSSANPGANGLMNQASGQVARLSGASNSCQEAKKDCEQKCDTQKQKANADPKAKKTGEPAQVDQSKGSSCTQAMDASIAPLLMGLAAALAALAMAKKSEEQSDAGTPGFTNPTTDPTTPIATKPPEPVDKKGEASFLAMPQAKAGFEALKNAGAEVSKDGVKMPDGSQHSWGSLAGGGGGSGSGGVTGSGGQASLDGLTASPQSLAYAPKSTTLNEGDGGGGSSAGGYADDPSSENYKLHERDGGRGPSSVTAAGMKTSFNGTPIGAKSDDLFSMIHRAYAKKRNENVFLETTAAVAAPPPQKRMPASANMPKWYRRAN